MRKHCLEIRENLTLKLGATVAAGLFFATISAQSVADSVTSLSNLEVVAQRRDNALSSSVAIHNITSESIRTAGIIDISDAMRRLPGVNISDYGGTGGMKTVSLRGLGTQHTGVIYDGFVLGDSRNGSIDLSRYSLNSVSEIEVDMGDRAQIFVPARALQSATTLNLRSVSPAISGGKGVHGVASIRIGSFEFINPYLKLTSSDGKNLVVTATGDYTYCRNNYPYVIHNVNRLDTAIRSNTNVSMGHGEVSALWQPRQGDELIAKIYYYGSDKKLPGPVIFYNPENHERLAEQNCFGQAMYRTRLSSLFTLMAAGKYDFNYTRYRDLNPIYTGGMLDRFYRQNEAYASATLLFTPFVTGLSAVYGIDYVYDDLTTNSRLGYTPRRHAVLQQLAASYSVACVSMTAKGLLSNYIDYGEPGAGRRVNTRISPSFSVAVSPIDSQDFHLRGSYRNIFRMPTFNELYYDHYGTINLQPEIADMFNVGVGYGLSTDGVLKNVSVTIDGFLNLISNKIVAIPYNMFLYTMTNYGKVRAYGTEITANVDLDFKNGHGLLLGGSYALQRTENRTSPLSPEWNKQVPYIPIHSGSGSVTWLNPWTNMVIHCTAAGKRYATGSNIESSALEAYADVGLSFYRAVEFSGQRLEVRADVSNLADVNYELIARYPMPGINWSATVTYSF